MFWTLFHNIHEKKNEGQLSGSTSNLIRSRGIFRALSNIYDETLSKISLP